MRRVLLMALVALSLPSIGQGKAAETFAFRKVARIEPAAWDLYTLGVTYKDVTTKSGLQYYEYIKPTKPTAFLNYLPVLEQLVWDADIGAWIIFSHGDSLGATTFEAYGGDMAGQALQIAALQAYSGPYLGEIMGVDIPDPVNPGKYFLHGVGVRPLFFSSRWYTPPAGKVYVDMRTCFGENMRSGFPGATFSGYDRRVTNADMQTHQNSQYLSLGGVTNGVRGRVLRNAISGQPSYWHIYGDLDLTLCPAIVDITPVPNPLTQRMTVRTTFDTKIAWPVDGTYIMMATGAAHIYNVEAESDTTLLFALTGTQKAAWGTVDIFSGTDGSYWNGITGYPAYTGLDGSGVYPNGDDYAFDVYSMLGDNPAAMVGGFTVTRETAGLTARWVVESESKTDRYLVQYATSPVDSFATVAEVPATNANVYQSVLNSPAEGFYRLQEVETDGNILTQAYTSADDSQPITTNSVVPAEIAPETRYPSPKTSEQMLATYTDVIYTDTVFLTQAQYIANYQTSIGIPTVVQDVGGLQGVAAGIKADFAARISSGARNMLKFGDANDDRDAQGNLRYNNPAMWDSGYVKSVSGAPQPLNNLIPVAQYPVVWGPQETSMTYWEKFYPNDWADIDMDGDGLPDPGLSLGRLPVTTYDEAWNVAYKTTFAHQINIGTYGVNHVFAFTYAFDLNGNSGAEAKAVMDSVLAYVPSSRIINRYTDEPSYPYSDANRDALCIANFDRGSALHIYAGTVNGRYHNAGCLDQNRSASLALNQSRLAFLLVLGCGGGDFDRTETAVGRPLNEQLLENRNERGAWGYFGPSRGSWQYGNYLMGKEFLKQLYSVGAPSVSQAAARAVYNVATAHPEFKDLALSYNLVAPTSVRLAGMVVNTTGVDDQPVSSPLALAPPAPNPSRGLTAIRFTLPTSSQVDITVHDVMGRRVEKVVSGRLTAGRHSQSVRMNYAPGEYFVRMVANGQQRVQKMVVVR